jgi:effector-binding domain-containing protein
MKKFLFVLLALAAIFVAVGLLFLPRQVQVQRSVEIAMPASTVFTLLNGFASFNAWSPWSDKDPEAEYIYSGPETGVGAKLSWSGNRLLGKGSQEIINSEAYTQIEVLLDFDGDGVAKANYLIEPRNEAVLLTWSYDTDVTLGLNFYDALIARYVGLMFDRWIGRDYEAGLANFKQFAERLPRADFSDLEATVTEVAAWDILYVSNQVEQDPDLIAAALAAAFAEINAFMRSNNLFPMAQPLAITRFSSDGSYVFDAAVPVSIPPGLETDGAVKLGRSPEGYAVKTVHQGSYGEMSGVYEKLGAYMAAHGYQQGDVSWEHYITQPETTAEGEQITHIYYLINPPKP